VREGREGGEGRCVCVCCISLTLCCCCVGGHTIPVRKGDGVLRSRSGGARGEMNDDDIDKGFNYDDDDDDDDDDDNNMMMMMMMTI
jgi:hypothetical protein